MDSAISVEISRLYVSFFNRAADPEGLQYWVSRYEEAIAQGRDGKDFLEDIADSFAQSPEAKAIYETTANPTDAQIEAYIAEAYQNMFGRVPDDEGLAYWAGRWKAEMAEGKPGVRVLFEIENAARGSSNADDVAALQNKAEVAAKFTTDFIASGAEWTDEDFATAGSIVDGVDHTPESVQQANDQIAEFIETKTDPDGGQEPNQPGPVDPGPTNVAGAVTIDGEAKVGEELTAHVTDGNGLVGVTVTYQWFVGDQPITGATASTYIIDAETFGQQITVKASYVDNAGFAGTVEATTTNDVSVGAPDGTVLLFNPGTSGSTPYATIQAAVEAAGSGAIILVTDGTYKEQVNVHGKSNITIIGEEGAIVQAPDTLVYNEADIGTRDRASVISVTSSTDIVLRGLIVDGDHNANKIPGGGGDFVGVFFGNSSGAAESLVVKNVGDPRIDIGSDDTAVSGNQRGNAIVVQSTNTTGKAVALKNNEIFDFQKNGVTITGEGLNVIATGNTIKGDGFLSFSGAQAQNGIQVSYGRTQPSPETLSLILAGKRPTHGVRA